ncbi:hypothetical protein QJS10_CPA08g00811 [Acorus calamus]|uniref:Uncharacterized protein n=1 Tax=Acorus calamus TaxID=4465 RepID=A0AAV9ECM0_ACOCL|nr:hypothetical protein QJS10_CPA08g00811 [Acorus calamus]
MKPHDIRATKGTEGTGFPIRSCTPHPANNPEVAFHERGGGRAASPRRGKRTRDDRATPFGPDGHMGRIGGHRGMGEMVFPRGIPGGRAPGRGDSGGEPTAAPEIVKDAGRDGSWPHGGGESLPSQTG